MSAKKWSTKQTTVDFSLWSCVCPCGPSVQAPLFQHTDCQPVGITKPTKKRTPEIQPIIMPTKRPVCNLNFCFYDHWRTLKYHSSLCPLIFSLVNVSLLCVSLVWYGRKRREKKSTAAYISFTWTPTAGPRTSTNREPLASNRHSHPRQLFRWTILSESGHSRGTMPLLTAEGHQLLQLRSVCCCCCQADECIAHAQWNHRAVLWLVGSAVTAFWL